jgi:hypothetical protein
MMVRCLKDCLSFVFVACIDTWRHVVIVSLTQLWVLSLSFFQSNNMNNNNNNNNDGIDAIGQNANAIVRYDRNTGALVPVDPHSVGAAAANTVLVTRNARNSTATNTR